MAVRLLGRWHGKGCEVAARQVPPHAAARQLSRRGDNKVDMYRRWWQWIGRVSLLQNLGQGYYDNRMCQAQKDKNGLRGCLFLEIQLTQGAHGRNHKSAISQESVD